MNDRTWFGRFQIAPLSSGVGTTVANSLRRSLLYEVPGYGITWVDIDGALFPFSVLKGVRESVLDISLNLKKVGGLRRCWKLGVGHGMAAILRITMQDSRLRC